METKRIILIDPSTESNEALAERLGMQGYQVTVAHDAGEGARLALADPPAALIADLWMPSISGVQLCRLLSTEPATEFVPVILRGPEGPRNHFWSERAGAAAYVARGRMGDLVRALARAIAQAPASDDFFTAYSAHTDDIRERIATRLDAALFESVLAAEVRALGTCGEFDRLFDLFSQFVARVTSYRWLAVSTVQPARLGIHTVPGLRHQAEREVRAVLEVAEDARLIAVEDEDAFNDESGPPPLVQPIELGGVVLGHLAMAPRDPANPHDADLAAVVARELAGPIRIATLVEESQRLATIDGLTGLMNRRAFRMALEKETARAERYGQPFSFLLLDVDHFKQINDRSGHGAGDRVLSALGQLLKKVARASDGVARWGGEEFVVALSMTDLAGGAIAGERFRKAIESLEVADSHGVRIPVTASIGLAQLMPGESIEALVDRADRAMYTSKCGGRNRLSAAETPKKLAAVAG